MTSDNKRGRGRPTGLGPRRTNVSHGAYTDPGEAYQFWKKHNPGLAGRVDDHIRRHLRALGWDEKHPRYKEVRDLAIRTVSRGMLLMKIIDKDFARIVRDPKTGQEVKQRPADQFARLEELDDEIKIGLEKLGLLKLKSINKGDYMKPATEERIREKLNSVHSDLDTARAEVEGMIEDQNTLLKALPTANPERLRVLQRAKRHLDAASDTVASILDAENLKIKDGAKPSKSIIDDAYAKAQSSANDK